MIYAGIDAGSRATKVVLFDSKQSRVIGARLADHGTGALGAAILAGRQVCRGPLL